MTATDDRKLYTVRMSNGSERIIVAENDWQACNIARVFHVGAVSVKTMLEEGDEMPVNN